ncbi:MAG TPA: hypothetical protein VEG61_04530 [Candidatus Dormibacteraeota bacterium]|nr:hypothetical protein [Candidatus Dormibacteraeota bacterium]
MLTVFESLAREAMKDHEKRFQDRIRSVRDAGNALDNAASRFEAAVQNAWGTMDKSASEYGTRMAQTIEEATRKLSRQQTSASYDDAQRFHKDSIAALNTIIKTIRKYVPKLRRGLRVEMAALNVALGKLEAAVRSLGLALEQSPGNRIEVIRRDILHFTEARAELTKLKTDEVEAANSREANAAKERDALADAREFFSNDAILELTRYEESLRAKEEEIAQFLQPIMKPLTKLQRNETSSKNETVDLRTLRNLVDRPVETLATGQPFTLVQLLNQLDEALTHGRLEIEERRRRKAEETIKQAREGEIEKLREDYLTIQANVQETLRQLKTTGLLDKKNEIEQREVLIRNEKERLISQDSELRRRIDAITKALIKQKQSVEQQIKQVTSKSLEIQIE